MHELPPRSQELSNSGNGPYIPPVSPFESPNQQGEITVPSGISLPGEQPTEPSLPTPPEASTAPEQQEVQQPQEVNETAETESEPAADPGRFVLLEDGEVYELDAQEHAYLNGALTEFRAKVQYEAEASHTPEDTAILDAVKESFTHYSEHLGIDDLAQRFPLANDIHIFPNSETYTEALGGETSQTMPAS